MGYTPKRGHAPKFMDLGSSPALNTIKEEKFDVDKLVDQDFQDSEGTQYDVDEHNVHAHRTEGSIKAQDRIRKERQDKKNKKDVPPQDWNVKDYEDASDPDKN